MAIKDVKVRGKDVSTIVEQLPFDAWCDTNIIERKGDIWFLWLLVVVIINHLRHKEQEIHATVKVHATNTQWLEVTYASTKLGECRLVWHNLKTIDNLHNMP